MPAADLAADLALIEAAVREGGALARASFGHKLKIWNKSGGSPVTETDLAVNALLAERLRGARPDYGWLSEESADDPGRLAASTLFIVDPIDGTTAFIKQRPHFTICAGIVREGRPVCGAVYNPILDECYTAMAGGGAHLNGAAIHVSARSDIAGCRMLAGRAIFEHPFWHTPPQQPWPPMTVETLSSIAYRLVLVAAGRFDAALALSTKHEWDLAAAEIIVEEAGGKVSDHRGRRLRYNTPGAEVPALVCAGPALHAALVAKLEPVVLPP